MSSFSKKSIVSIFCVVLLLAIIDAVTRVYFWESKVVLDIVDIQTPAVLDIKLDSIRRFEGRKIIFLGDSLVYGRAMEEHGIANWRQHTVSAIMRDLIESENEEIPTMLINLAMNGALPADLEKVSNLIAPLQPDLVVTDLSLRSFSTDFSDADTKYSRRWLDETKLDPEGIDNSELSSFANWFERLARKYWFLYKIRDFLQWRYLNGEPRMYVRNLKAKLNNYLRDVQPDVGSPMETMVLLFKARSRYRNISLISTNLQVRAFKRMLGGFNSRKQSAIFFYATENPDLLPKIVDIEAHNRNLGTLASFVSELGGITVRYIPPMTTLQSDMFLDHVHLNKDGYRLLAHRLWSDIKEIM